MKGSIFYLKSKRMGLHTDKTRCENLKFTIILGEHDNYDSDCLQE